MKKLLASFIIINLSFAQYACAQNRTIDSLSALLKVMKNDTATVNRLNVISWEFRNQNPDTALYFAKDAYSIASKINYTFGIADAQLKMGSALRIHGKSDEALAKLNEALIFFNKLLAKNNYSERTKLIKGKAATISNIGLVLNDIGKFDKALSNLFAALKLSENINDSIEIANSFYRIGVSYYYMANYTEVLKYLFKSLKITQQLKDLKSSASTYNFIAINYQLQGKYSEALKIYFQTLKLSERLKDKKEMHMSYSNIGTIYHTQKNFTEALKYYLLSLKLKLELGDETQVAAVYLNIGLLYSELEKNEKAIENYLIGLKYAQKVNDKRTIIKVYNTIADTYFKQKKYEDGLKLSLDALKSSIEIGDKVSEFICNTYISRGYLFLNNKAKATFYAKQNLQLVKEIGTIDFYKECYTLQAQIDSAQGNYKQALEYYKLAIIYRDSIENKENTKKIVEAQMNYEFDKKQTADSIKVSADKKVLHAQIAQQKTQRNGFVVGFALVLLLAGFIFRNYKQKQKANLLLEEKNIAITSQKEVIEEQKKTVEVKQKQIVDSINYAKRIQESILIPEQTIQQHLPNSFVLFIPRDIVSGDFYWFHQQGNQSIVVCADCTGHGVPGAFLSMVGSTLLNEIVVHKQITDPANIMKQLAAGVSDTLKHKEKDEMDTDGMDISICTISNKDLYFAAANNPIYVVNQNGLKEIEPQVNSINGIFEMNGDEKIESIKLSPEAGSMIYMSTDGFADQPGQTTKKKLYSAGFEKMLIELHHLPLQEQKEKLANFFNEWKGNLKQHDDILVMGIRV